MSGLHLLADPEYAALLALLVSALSTAIVLRYALRKGLLDAPGQRRSHAVPTPRGGGVGLIAGALAGMACALWLAYPPGLCMAFALACVLVASVGWWDDHRPLPAWPRLVVHLAASMLFVGTLLAAAGWSWWWLLPLVLVAAWSINAHNFMDGIDGLLGLQLVFVGLGTAMLSGALRAPALVSAGVALSAAAVGFLLYNRPPARIFMGDVGSGTAGLLVFMLGGLECREDPHAVWPVLILNAVFMCDAGWTLLWRMLRGRRWYTAHREHAYQWLVRCGFTHGQTGCLYLALNVAVCAPLAWAAHDQARLAPWLCIGAYVVLSAAWWLGRRACMRLVRRGGRHANA